MKQFARSRFFAAAVVALCALLAVVTLRATARQLMSGPQRPLAQQESAPDPPASPPAAPATPPAETPAPPPAPAPKPPGGVGGIRLDDATVAPDKSQSADNNVSFPTDI